MSDRMKTISLRRFRERAAEITEPMEIAVRDRDGNFRVLGYFTPYPQHEAPTVLDLEEATPEAVEAVRTGISAGTIRTPEEAVAVARSVRPIRPFPKTAQTGQKRRA